MNSIQVLKELIEKLEAYELNAMDKNALSVEGFMEFLHSPADLGALRSALIDSPKPEMLNNPHRIENNIERVIAQHLILLNRYIKFYSKTAFASSKIKTLEEFSFMMTVMQHGQITKTDLIKRNIIEKSSGIEIINRMVKIGMLEQTHNPKDHRSHLIQLTENGRIELFKIFRNMDVLGKIASGPLTSYEKEQLAVMLKKLDQFHYDNYNNKNLKTLDDFLPDTET